MTAVCWTPQAADDLEAIFDFIARDSPHYARLIVDDILAAVDKLEQFPQIGRAVPERPGADLRELIKPPYRIVYRLGEGIHILTIFRASRLFPVSVETAD